MIYFIDQLLNGLSLGCIYALIALGFAMVFGVLRFLNFAHSEIFTAGAFIGYFVLRWLSPFLGGSPFLLVGLAMLTAGLGAAALAVLIERLAYRPLRGYSGVTVLLSAIGVSILLQNLGIHAWSAHTRGYPAVALPIAPKQFALIVLVLSFGLLFVLVNRTPIGIQMRAVAEDSSIAQLMGVDPARIIVLVFFLGGFFAGIAGVVWGLVYGSIHPQMGFYPGLKAFIIAVVGSIGSLTGTFLTGVCLGVTESLLAAYLPSTLSAYRDPIVFALLIAALVWKPSGIFGKPTAVKV
jgi:branched-chain amino acid transport system permease protein